MSFKLTFTLVFSSTLQCAFKGLDAFTVNSPFPNPLSTTLRQGGPLFLTHSDGEGTEDNFFDNIDGFNIKKDHNNDDHVSYDLEALRQKLEALVDSSGRDTSSSAPTLLSYPPSFSSPTSTLSSAKLSSSSSLEELEQFDLTSLPPSPPLTTLERERRRAEINLLARVEHDDQAVTDLWDLWFHERGNKAFNKLNEAETLVQQGSHDHAERALKTLIKEYGIWWSEPVNRLATLYYLQGRYAEAERMCQAVLKVKPWHFGALSGIVHIYAAQRNSDAARQWAARRLPALTPQTSNSADTANAVTNRRRSQWVERALNDAQQMLAQAEKRNEQLFFGPADSHVEQSRLQLQQSFQLSQRLVTSLDDAEGDDENDAWQ